VTFSDASTSPAPALSPEPIRPDGWPAGAVDPDELTPCAHCNTLDQWQTLTGNWRCLRCDPPTKARRLRDRAAQLKTDRRFAQDERKG
jgi:hypothetical protein